MFFGPSVISSPIIPEEEVVLRWVTSVMSVWVLSSVCWPKYATVQFLIELSILSYILSVSINGLNSRVFASGSCDATACLWDTRVASRAVQTFHGHERDVNTVKFFPDGNSFGTGSEDGTCRLFDIRTGHQLQVYHQQNNDTNVPHVTSIAFSISGRLLFAGYSNGDCFVWDTLLATVLYYFLAEIVTSAVAL